MREEFESCAKYPVNFTDNINKNLTTYSDHGQPLKKKRIWQPSQVHKPPRAPTLIAAPGPANGRLGHVSRGGNSIREWQQGGIHLEPTDPFGLSLNLEMGLQLEFLCQDFSASSLCLM